LELGVVVGAWEHKLKAVKAVLLAGFEALGQQRADDRDARSRDGAHRSGMFATHWLADTRPVGRRNFGRQSGPRQMTAPNSGMVQRYAKATVDGQGWLRCRVVGQWVQRLELGLFLLEEGQGGLVRVAMNPQLAMVFQPLGPPG